MRTILMLLTLCGMLVLFGCDLAKDTSQTTENGADGAAGIAQKMSEGTVGDANEDTGE